MGTYVTVESTIPWDGSYRHGATLGEQFAIPTALAIGVPVAVVAEAEVTLPRTLPIKLSISAFRRSLSTSIFIVGVDQSVASANSDGGKGPQ